MNSSQVHAAGMVWYLAEDFDEIKALMEDAHTLHRTYTEWLQAAERGEQAQVAKGLRVYRAVIRPDEFRDWCRTRSLKVDAKARQQYASWFAAKEYSEGR